MYRARTEVPIRRASSELRKEALRGWGGASALHAIDWRPPSKPASPTGTVFRRRPPALFSLHRSRPGPRPAMGRRRHVFARPSCLCSNPNRSLRDAVTVEPRTATQPGQRDCHRNRLALASQPEFARRRGVSHSHLQTGLYPLLLRYSIGYEDPNGDVPAVTGRGPPRPYDTVFTLLSMTPRE